MSYQAFLKAICPPLIWQGVHRLRGGRSLAFEGDYSTWAEAEKAAGGYDSPAILDRVRAAALKVKQGEAVFERDSVCFHHEEYRWPTLACLLRIAAMNGGWLRVLDFGGSLGSFWFQHRKLLKGMREVRWAVVEQPHYVEYGQKEFQDEVLSFHKSVEECLRAGPVDVILLSCVLQYLSDPYGWIKRFGDTGVRWLLLDRTPFIEQKRDRLTVQRVPPSIYPASYPAWFFSRRCFAEAVESAGYKEILRFDAMDDVGIGKFEGVWLERNA
ncbi:methyltransferase, TIGR04325 family [Alcanivorax sp.]|uniref:methyltransferase, TIGR04325 family n=1 Tax=Alcanivorax sp. TaxID=1872427 RepID=UPI0025857ED9|nr:methyltransferase, TIGR04325 family [Alcanivorax sp.]